MADRKLLRKEFRELEQAVNRLKEAEKELEALNPPQELFGAQVQSIRSKLKDPAKVEEVENELNELRKQVEEPEAQAAESQPALEKAPTPSVYTSREPFPREIADYYYDTRFLGSGGFARVFAAKRKSDGTEVALKVPERMDGQTGKSFLSEVTSWQRLSHRNIVELYDFNIFPIPYLQMELCQRNLGALGLPLEVEKAAGFVFHIAEGIKHAHEMGTIHRDIKPQNILLQGETPKVVDWGLSKVVAESKASSRSRSHMFSLYWAAPEQLSPKKFGKADKRTDIYQLGAVFYQLVTGGIPFKGDDITEIMGQILEAEPSPPSSLNPDASSVDPIIMKCLEKQMDNRYQDAAELQKALSEYLKVEYKDSLSESQGNMARSANYCAELCLLHLTTGDIADALKYAEDLKYYASENVQAKLYDLTSELEIRAKEEVGVPEELVDKAAIVLHQAKMGRQRAD